MQKILFLQYLNPVAYPPLEHSSQVLAQRGWRVMFLGIKQPETASLLFPAHERITVKQLSFCKPGWRQKLHYLWFTLYALTLTFSWRPRWIYASDPLSSPAACLLSLLPWIKVVYHEHDTPPSTNGSWFMKFVLASRKSLARKAELCVLPNEHRALHFSQELSNGHTVCVWNCPTLEDVGFGDSVRNGDAIWLLYHGSLVPDRLPLSILAALRQLPGNVKLRIAGFATLGYPNYAQDFLKAARDLDLEDRVEFVGAVPTRRELLEWCRRSHVGLSFMPTKSDDINMTHMTGASNKAFDYMASGMALLVSDLPDWRALFVEGGYGLSCDVGDPASIAGAVHWFLEHAAEMRLMGQRGRQKIVNEWNYEMHFAPVIEILSAA